MNVGTSFIFSVMFALALVGHVNCPALYFDECFCFTAGTTHSLWLATLTGLRWALMIFLLFHFLYDPCLSVAHSMTPSVPNVFMGGVSRA